MAQRSDLLDAIANTIAGYREGEIAAPDSAHVERWVNQFHPNVQLPILSETASVLEKTYITKENFKEFLAGIISSEKITGGDATAFWKGVKFLEIQNAGNSQRDMMILFDRELQSACSLTVADCGKNPHTYVYLDDALFSGGRIKSDIVGWINGGAPKAAKLFIITIANHMLGEFFAGKDINAAAKAADKAIELTWWRALMVEDRKAYMTRSDVLRPTAIPDDLPTKDYLSSLGAELVLRVPGGKSELALFSSEEARQTLEQEFLKSGVRVRAMCPHFNIYMRPLGSSLMKTSGFGSMIFTYRNCANNTPLVFWAGNPWYPLFPRKTN
jgi:hypothetical protein